MLTPEQIDRASALLARARAETKLLEAIPEDVRPRTIGEAYAIQDRLAERLGRRTRGWFCACTNAEIQAMLGLAEPYYARLFEDFVLKSPAVLDAARFPPIAIECEFGFALDRNLPPRGAPYGRPEVEAAVSSVSPTIEVVAGYLKEWPRQDVFSVIADNGTDGALIVGKPVADWRGIDLKRLAVTLRVDGEIVRTGQGSNVLGDPMDAFVWLVNARARDGDGLQAGHVHNTGTATGLYWAKPGEDVEADFGPLGTVKLTLT